MLFIGQQSALIELQKNTTTSSYLIGDELFTTLPTKILHKIVTTANWNRALRYLNQTNSEFIPCGFFLIRFELYLQDETIICLSKDSFEQKILDQSKFKIQFLPEIFAFRNRNFQFFKTQELMKNYDWEVINDLNLDLNRCWVNDEFSLKKYKFKVLFKKGANFKVEKTFQDQFIYYSSFDFEPWDVVDLKTGFFYQQGKYQLNVEACLCLETENQSLKDLFLTNLINEIQVSSQIPAHHKNWHLFNVTNEIKYLSQELNDLFQNFTFDEGIIELEKLFKELQTSYFSILLTNPVTKPLFFDFVHSKPEKEHLGQLISRYGILNFDDQETLRK